MPAWAPNMSANLTVTDAEIEANLLNLLNNADGQDWSLPIDWEDTDAPRRNVDGAYINECLRVNRAEHIFDVAIRQQNVLCCFYA